MISKNIDEKILKEISRPSNSYCIMERHKGKYGNGNFDIEYLLKRFRNINPKNKPKVIGMLN